MKDRPSNPKSNRQVGVICNAAADAPAETIGHPVKWANRLLPADLVSDEEVIILLLKPSILYIPLASLGSIITITAVTFLFAYLSTLKQPFFSWSERDAFVFGGMLLVIRLGWQTLDWWNRMYVLTDRRIISLSGILRRTMYEAALRNIQHIAVVISIRERLFGLGSMAFATAGSDRYDTIWFTLRRPYLVHRKIVQTMDRYGRHHPD